MLRTFIRNNITFAAIILFIVIFIAVYLAKPGCLYKQDGSIREFGVGTKIKQLCQYGFFLLF